MGEGAHGSEGCGLLTTACGCSADEEASVFTPEATGLPEMTSLVPKCLPLGGEVAVPGWDAKEEGVVGLEDVGGDGGEIRFGRGVHLAQDFF